jgi:hypothetical protein
VKYWEKSLLENYIHTRRIEAISGYAENQLLSKVEKSKWFSLQTDKYTDTTNKIMLSVHDKCIDFGKLCAYEEFMACLEILGHTTGDEIFKALDGYIQKHNLSWTDCWFVH